MQGRHFLRLLVLLGLACATGDRDGSRSTTAEEPARILRQESRMQAKTAQQNLECCALKVTAGIECEIRRVPPAYPKEAHRNRMSGKVLVEYSIGEDGRVRDARVLKSKPPEIFDEAALRSANAWQFCPGEPEMGLQGMLHFSLERP